MHRTSALLIVILGACGDGSSGASDAGVSDTAETAEPPFTVQTRQLGSADSSWQLSLTDAVGFDACFLADDYHTTDAPGTHQVIVNLGPRPDPLPASAACPTGTITVAAGCDAFFEDVGTAAVPTFCAYFRAFDVGTFEPATRGTIEITGDETSCTFTLDLEFFAGHLVETFTMTDLDGGRACN